MQSIAATDTTTADLNFMRSTPIDYRVRRICLAGRQVNPQARFGCVVLAEARTRNVTAFEARKCITLRDAGFESLTVEVCCETATKKQVCVSGAGLSRNCLRTLSI
jgi:hypothetical protein